MSTSIRNSRVRAIAVCALIFPAVAAMADSPRPAVGPDQVPTVRFEFGSANVPEDVGSVTLNVLRSLPGDGTATVSFYTQPNSYPPSPSPGVDYTPTTGTVVFGPNEFAKSISIPILDDQIAELTESFFVVFNQVAGATYGYPTTCQVNIVDNDAAPVNAAIDFVGHNYQVGEADGTVRLSVGRSGDLSATSTVHYATSESSYYDTARGGLDYTPVEGTLTFAPGETVKTFDVAILQDSIDEPQEAFSVVLSQYTNAYAGMFTTAAVAIVDDDPTPPPPPAPIFNFSAATYNVNENAGAVIVQLVRSGSTSGTDTLSYVAPSPYSYGSATEGQDFFAVSGLLTFAPGETAKSISIPILDDALPEPAESFTVSTYNVNTSYPALTSAQVVIADDDPIGTITLTPQQVTVNESAGSATINVYRSGVTTGTVTLSYATSNYYYSSPPTPGVDYVATSGVLTFLPGETAKAVTVQILEDTTHESSETFNVNFAVLSGNATIASNQQAPAITILDNDPIPTLTISSPRVVEGNSGVTAAVFTLRLSSPMSESAQYSLYFSDGTAKVIADYLPGSSSSITFGPGEISKDLLVSIVGDTVPEGDESFRLNAQQNYYPYSLTATGTCTIVDDDYAFSVDDAVVSEGNSGSAEAVITVKLSGALGMPASVDYTTVGGTASPGLDYETTSGTLTFAPGETSKTVSVPIFGDSDPETDEDFGIRLSNPAGAPLLRGAASIRILNDDRFFNLASNYEYAVAGGVSLMLDLYTPAAGTGPFPILVSVAGDHWDDGDKALSRAIPFASRGYAVASIEVRRSSTAKFPAQVQDAKAAIRWLRANAARFNLDPSRVAIWGSGSGGHVAALVGTGGDVVSLDDLTLGNPAFSSRVQAAIVTSAPIDLLQLQRDSLTCNTSNYDSSGSVVSLLLGCSVQTCPATATSANPITYISRDDPPFLLMHGTSDCTYPSAQADSFARALRSASVDTTLSLYPSIGHTSAFWDSAAVINEVAAFIEGKLKAAVPSRRHAAKK
jgi:acetyl esterase/lipase